MKFSPFILLLPLLFLLGACGSSNSSSGGGSVVVYLGVQRISVASGRIVGAPTTIAFRIDRNDDQITVVDQNFRATGTLIGSEFSVTSPVIEISLNGALCSYQVTYTGSVTQSNVSGTLNGPLECPLTGALSGTFEGMVGSNNSSAILPSVSALLGGG